MVIGPDTAVLLLAILADAVIGDPAWLYRAWPHPVALLGRAVNWFDFRLNRDGRGTRAAGAIALGAVVALAVTAGAVIHWLLSAIPYGWAAEALVMSTLIAGRGLYQHVAEVGRALERGDLGAARAAVAKIVGRETADLDEGGVARGGLESLAENFADGVVAPLFWGAILGLPGIAAYKAINTADSMIGHMTPRYRDFGWAAAKADDGANFLPARLAGLMIAGAALLVPGASARTALAAMMRDAPRHRSPNAGWPEAALAGALGLALAGPRRYHGVDAEDAWMGDGRAECTAADIRRGLGLYAIACAIGAGAIAVLALA